MCRKVLFYEELGSLRPFYELKSRQFWILRSKWLQMQSWKLRAGWTCSGR